MNKKSLTIDLLSMLVTWKVAVWQSKFTAVFQGITSVQSESSHVATRFLQKLKKMLGSLQMTNREESLRTYEDEIC
jgi:hypothetical protein